MCFLTRHYVSYSRYTSPRNTGISGENNDWDIDSGASFYLDATVRPWKQHYQMYSYVTQDYQN